jgi:hypothetical protein
LILAEEVERLLQKDTADAADTTKDTSREKDHALGEAQRDLLQFFGTDHNDGSDTKIKNLVWSGKPPDSTTGLGYSMDTSPESSPTLPPLFVLPGSGKAAVLQSLSSNPESASSKRLQNLFGEDTSASRIVPDAPSASHQIDAGPATAIIPEHLDASLDGVPSDLAHIFKTVDSSFRDSPVG